MSTTVTWSRGLAWGWLALLGIAALLTGWQPATDLAPDLASSNVPPLTPHHWLGTDPLGQDVLLQLLYGARTALQVSLPAAALAATLGTLLGVLAGYWGNSGLRFPRAYWLAAGGAAAAYGLFTVPGTGIATSWWPLALTAAVPLLGHHLKQWARLRRQWAFPLDSVVLVAIVLLAAMPRLLLVLTVAAAAEPTLPGLVALLTLTSWTPVARLARAEVRRVRQLPYLEAAYAAGLPPWRLMCYHLLPNIWRPVATTLPLSVAVFISLETTLSFLGVGLPPETPSWGRLLALGRLAPSSWWLILFPALCLLATTLALRQLLAGSLRTPSR